MLNIFTLVRAMFCFHHYFKTKYILNNLRYIHRHKTIILNLQQQYYYFLRSDIDQLAFDLNK